MHAVPKSITTFVKLSIQSELRRQGVKIVNISFSFAAIDFTEFLLGLRFSAHKRVRVHVRRQLSAKFHDEHLEREDYQGHCSTKLHQSHPLRVGVLCNFNVVDVVDRFNKFAFFAFCISTYWPNPSNNRITIRPDQTEYD